ncbi:MAG: PAS domain S-box protein [Chlamydiia bacterium]|nr:PAS domain S-box protein [Chlamydiia bacterium]
MNPSQTSASVLQKRFEAMFHTLPYAVLLCDPQQTIIDCNRKAEEDLGLSKQALKAKLFQDLLPDEIAGAGRELFQRLAVQEQCRFESALRRQDGEVFPAEIYSIVLNDGENVLIELIIREMGDHKLLEHEILHAYNQLETLITKRTQQLSQSNEELRSELILRKKIEEELRRKQGELESVNQKLKENQVLLVHIEKMATLGQMTASITHEINNPIAFVHSNLRTLEGYTAHINALVHAQQALIASLEGGGGPAATQAKAELRAVEELEDTADLLVDSKQLVRDCLDGMHQVNEIICSLKNFAYFERTSNKEVDLNEGIRSTVKIAWNQIKRACEVEFDLQPLPVINCAAGQLNQVFMNLIINASQAMSKRGIIWIRSRHDQDIISIEIQDNGGGIAPENLKKIFDPFFTTKGCGEGTGLGLAICRQIIQNHGGTLELRSKVGEGTVAQIKLPVKGKDAE